MSTVPLTAHTAASTPQGTPLRRLLHSLAVACELEHGLSLQYLFTAFSLKQDMEEGGMTLAELITVRKWRANLFFIAAQEMLHLAQAANISAAVGSGLTVRRPNFPQRPSYYPTDLPWGLWPFSAETLILYTLYERPTHLNQPAPAWLPAPADAPQTLQALWADAPAQKDPFVFLPANFERPQATQAITIEALYRQIACDLRDAGDIFHGPAAAQVAAQTVDFPQLIQVFKLNEALDGITLITHQGEGAPSDRQDSHFGMFVAMYEEYAALKAQRPEFSPVRDVQPNPLSRLHADNNYPGWRLIQDPYTRDVNDLCSDSYALMLALLQQVFAVTDATQAQRRAFAGISFRLMNGVLTALGDCLTRLPMGDDSAGGTARPQFAGPSFELGLIQPGTLHAITANAYVRAELWRLEQQACDLAAQAQGWVSVKLQGVANTLAQLRLGLDAT